MKESEDFNYLPFVDVLFNVLIVVVILLALNKSEKKSDPSMSANVIYQIVMDWDGKSTTDMDLWAKDPAGNITGFKNREGGDGSLFALAQDDRGAMTDTKPDGTVVEVNQEIVSIRGTKPGEYLVTGYAYARADKQNLKVSCKLVKIKPFQEIKVIERTFTATAQEQTFFRFKLDEKGEVVDINELPGNVAKFDGPVPASSLEVPQ